MHALADIAGRSIALCGIFALVLIVYDRGQLYPRRSWQRAICRMTVGFLTAVAVGVALTR